MEQHFHPDGCGNPHIAGLQWFLSIRVNDLASISSSSILSFLLDLEKGDPYFLSVKLVRGSMARLALATALLASSSALGKKTSGPLADFKKGIQPVLEKHCYHCHGREKTKGKVNLNALTSWKDFESNPLLIEKMIEALDKNEMPPEEETQPSETQRKFILVELNKAFQNALLQGGNQPVIPLRLRRMNRFEYGNAVRDLFNLKSWVYSINDRIIRDHNNYFRPESREMPKVVSVGNRIMGLQQMLELLILLISIFLV